MSDAKEQSFRDVMKGNIWVLTWTRFIYFFHGQMSRPYFSLYIKHLGGSPANIGLVESLASLTSVIITPIGGYLADFYGRIKLISSSLYFQSIAHLVYAFSTSWVTLAIGKFYQGLTEYYHAAQSAIIADSLRPGRRAVGFASVNTLPNVVSLVAPALGAFIIAQLGLDVGMRYLLVFSFISVFLTGFCRGKFLKETIKRDQSKQETSHRGILSLIKEGYKSSWETLKWTPKNLMVFVVIHVLSSFSGSMVAPFWVIYAQDVIQIDIAEWGLILFVQGIFNLLVSIPAGMLVDKIGNRKMIVITLLCALFPMLLFVYCKTFIQTLVVMIVITLINSFNTPACGAWLADSLPRKIRARVTSAYGRGGIGIRGQAGGGGWGYVLLIPSTLGSILGGFIYTFNPIYPWFIHTGSLFISLILSVMFLREVKSPEI